MTTAASATPATTRRTSATAEAATKGWHRSRTQSSPTHGGTSAPHRLRPPDRSSTSRTIAARGWNASAALTSWIREAPPIFGELDPIRHAAPSYRYVLVVRRPGGSCSGARSAASRPRRSRTRVAASTTHSAGGCNVTSTMLPLVWSEATTVSFDLYALRRPSRRNGRDAGHCDCRRHGLGHEDHHVVGAACTARRSPAGPRA